MSSWNRDFLRARCFWREQFNDGLGGACTFSQQAHKTGSLHEQLERSSFARLFSCRVVDRCSGDCYGSLFQNQPWLRLCPRQVAAASSLQSESLGAAGFPSATDAAFQEFAEASTSQELARLLKHPNPVVRAYAADYLALKRPADARLLLPIFRDESRIDTQTGDIIMKDVLYVDGILDHLCPQAAYDETIQSLLLAVGKGEAQSFLWSAPALRCVAPYRAEAVAPLLRPLLVSAQPSIRAAAVFALMALGPADLQPQLKRLQIDDHPMVRSALATALQTADGLEQIAILGALVEDKDAEVRKAALASAQKRMVNKGPVTLTLLRSLIPAVRKVAIYGLGAQPTAENLTSLAEHYRSRPADIPLSTSRPFGVLVRRTAEHGRFMRAMLRVPSPVRYLAIKQLGDWTDTQSTADIRSFLRSALPEERIEAERAAGKLADSQAAPDLVRLLESPLTEERMAAASSLVNCGGREHLQALKKAVAREPAATAAKLEQYLQWMEARP